jgi:hypothetical protein
MTDIPKIKQEVQAVLNIPVDVWTDDMLLGAYVALGVSRQRGTGITQHQADVIEAARSWRDAMAAMDQWEQEAGWAIELSPMDLLDRFGAAEQGLVEALDSLDKREAKVAG